MGCYAARDRPCKWGAVPDDRDDRGRVRPRWATRGASDRAPGLMLQASTIRRRLERRQVSVEDVELGDTYFDRVSPRPLRFSVAEGLADILVYRNAAQAAEVFAGVKDTFAMLHSANALIVWSAMPQPHPAQLRLLEECVFGKNAHVQASPRVAPDSPREEPFSYSFWPLKDYRPDPATRYDPRPLLTEVKNIMKGAYPEIFGGAAQTPDGAIRVGVTGPAALPIREVLLSALPNARIEVHPMRYSWSRLLTIANELGERLAADTSQTVVSVAPDEEKNVVRVGVTDLNSPISLAIATYYADAVEMFHDAPFRFLNRSPPLDS